MATKTKSIKHVQSCIVSVSFPETLEGVLNMVKRNMFLAEWSTDLDTLLNFKSGDELFWTAPKWMTEGDVIFFYQTKISKLRTAKLLNEAQEKFPQKKHLINLLKCASENSALYSGSIFACASVGGATRLFEQQEKHFVSRLFAPLQEISIFEHPLQQDLFAYYVRIGRNTITPLFKTEFNGIKKLLSQKSILPIFLRQSVSGDKVFKNVNRKNWRSISCAFETKFIHEAQLRAYLTDFLLNELKDRGTSLLEECECFRGVRRTGIADYFVNLSGQWIPVEVKLDISREKHLLDQVLKYMNITSFTPTKGIYQNRRFTVSSIRVCIVLDRFGMYFISQNGTFIKSKIRNPFWKREDFAKEFAQTIRDEIKKHID